MTVQIESEGLFEAFCEHNGLDWLAIPTGALWTPDYRLRLNGHSVAVEIKQIESHDGFNPAGSSSRIVGAHVRRRIEEGRKQVQQAALAKEPAILLIYNAIDPAQLFGTEQHDFTCGMYGESTVRIVDGQMTKSFHGRNATLRPGQNTSFSGVGHLRRHTGGATVTVYENVYATWPLPFDALPSCIDVVRIEVEDSA